GTHSNLCGHYSRGLFSTTLFLRCALTPPRLWARNERQDTTYYELADGDRITMHLDHWLQNRQLTTKATASASVSRTVIVLLSRARFYAWPRDLVHRLTC